MTTILFIKSLEAWKQIIDYSKTVQHVNDGRMVGSRGNLFPNLLNSIKYIYQQNVSYSHSFTLLIFVRMAFFNYNTMYCMLILFF